MIRIKIISVGKNQESWLEEALQMYATRLSKVASFEFVWLASEDQLESRLAQEKHLVLLDLEGREFDSVGFANWFAKEAEKAKSRLTFAIGPANGFSAAIKKGATMIKLSSLTFTHQIVRLILVEQIFRAFEINKGSQYHK